MALWAVREDTKECTVTALVRKVFVSLFESVESADKLNIPNHY
jgi:hypothetical protein